MGEITVVISMPEDQIAEFEKLLTSYNRFSFETISWHGERSSFFPNVGIKKVDE